jgi:arginine decarboxylase
MAERPTVPLYVTYGSGEGSTTLSAFDAALWSAGIANFNLVKLSSIVPPGRSPVPKKLSLQGKDFGHRLYVVISQQDETVSGREAWAGLGWVMSTRRGGGLLVEHHGPARDEVLARIESSLKDLVSYRKQEFGPIKHQITGIKCVDRPVSSIVAAVFAKDGWGRVNVRL